MRFRITIRGEGVELRGYIDSETGSTLEEVAIAMKPFGLVIASPADDDYNPFTEWVEKIPPNDIEALQAEFREGFDEGRP